MKSHSSHKPNIRFLARVPLFFLVEEDLLTPTKSASSHLVGTPPSLMADRAKEERDLVGLEEELAVAVVVADGLEPGTSEDFLADDLCLLTGLKSYQFHTFNLLQTIHSPTYTHSPSINYDCKWSPIRGGWTRVIDRHQT